jgi:hypothetical protein
MVTNTYILEFDRPFGLPPRKEEIHVPKGHRLRMEETYVNGTIFYIETNEEYSYKRKVWGFYKFNRSPSRGYWKDQQGEFEEDDLI